jgi:UDP-glucose 4-epimerase
MRVLVTGGAGYIGSIVSEVLVQDGHEVVVYDNLSKGHRAAVAEGAVFVEGDLLDTPAIRQAFEQHAVEAVIHMAASSLVGVSMLNPAAYYRNNVAAGLSLLDAMRHCEVKRLVFSSTAAVYGEPAKQPIEESDPTHPTNPYGETKLAFERALHWYETAYDMRYVSLRYFNAAGASERFGEDHDPETHLIPIVLDVAAGGREDVTIFGDDYPTQDGTCVRDYIHVVDLARAHVLALGYMDGRSSIFNLGCGGGVSVREVTEVAREVTGHPIPVRVGARRTGDPATLVASSERAMRELGWKPERQDLRQIVGSAWAWIKAHPKGYGDRETVETAPPSRGNATA